MAVSATLVRLSALAVAVLAIVQGCSYGFTGNLPPHLSSVRIAPFRSSADEYGLEQELTSLFVEELVSEGRLSVVTASPDAVVECRITGFFRTPYSFSSSEEVQEYRIEMRAVIDFTDLVRDEKILDEESIDEYIVYDPVREDYSAAKQRLLVQMADEMARRCISGW